MRRKSILCSLSLIVTQQPSTILRGTCAEGACWLIISLSILQWKATVLSTSKNMSTGFTASVHRRVPVKCLLWPSHRAERAALQRQPVPQAGRTARPAALHCPGPVLPSPHLLIDASLDVDSQWNRGLGGHHPYPVAILFQEAPLSHGRGKRFLNRF